MSKSENPSDVAVFMKTALSADETWDWNGCVFNTGVTCIEHGCASCGWNPDVAKARIEQLREARKIGQS